MIEKRIIEKWQAVQTGIPFWNDCYHIGWKVVTTISKKLELGYRRAIQTVQKN
jgi:hypothetical protein